MDFTVVQKKTLVALLSVFVVSLIITALSVAKWAYSRSSRPDSTRSITVSDSATVKVKPDTAFITIGVTNRGKSASVVSSVNASKTSAVVNAIVKTGIPKSNVTTVDFSIQPEMNYKKSLAVIVGYSAHNSVRIRTKDLDKLSKLIDTAVSAGANNVREISFDIENPQELHQKALALAVKKAGNKARTIAQSIGAKLGPAISASESMGDALAYSINSTVSAGEMPGMPSQTPIEPGQKSVTAQVEVVYSLR